MITKFERIRMWISDNFAVGISSFLIIKREANEMIKRQSK